MSDTKVRTKSYSLGDVILTCDPLVHVINGDQKCKRCDHCVKKEMPSKPLKVCSKCRQMFYCDRNCQMNDWRCHRFECDLFRLNGAQLSECEVYQRLLLRVYLCFEHHFNARFADKRFQLDSDWIALNELKVDVHSFGSDVAITSMFARICDKYSRFGVDFNRQTLFTLFCKVSSFAIRCEAVDNSIFILPDIYLAIYIPLCVLGHSCAPNAGRVVVSDTRLQLRAIKAIADDQHISITRVDLNQSKAKRRKYLKRYHSIDCKCVKCDSNFDDGVDYDKLVELERRMKEALNGLKQTRDYETLRDIQQELRTIYDVIYEECNPFLSSHHIYTYQSRVIANILSKRKEDLNSIRNKIAERIQITHGVTHSLYRLFITHLFTQELSEPIDGRIYFNLFRPQ